MQELILIPLFRKYAFSTSFKYGKKVDNDSNIIQPMENDIDEIKGVCKLDIKKSVKNN